MRLPSISSLLCFAGLVALPVTAYDDPNIKSIPPYLDSDFQSRWFDFGGDTVIRADKYVRLTADRPSQQGWISSRVPLTATNWQIELEFEIHGSGNLHGDGFALWLTKERATQGPVFGSTDRFEGLGIFFDTYKNNRPGVSFPYVMAMMGDGHTTYDQAHDGKANELAGCSARGLRSAPVPTKARLTYFQDKSLSLELQYKSEDSWVECFNLSAEDSNIAIPSVAYLGLSAETGELSDNHDIISLKAENLYSLNRSNDNKGKTTEGRSKGPTRSSIKPVKEKSSWSWFLFKTILFFAVIVGGYFGWTIYRTKARSSRF
ncbi:Concanavalin A-like lectin/glucanases superfamily [Penicillium expansum]|uniref:Concanavalin A-like lectin/glucanases superfamily n=1 Tax=Penicillium expansum TaxID=27334 RepID=A0A0A2JZX7_PENEN|nr:Concanavalin A-like lectin/glucanases superfamily [Penicillium expansum]KGO49017.1 Concanavalin A-like lectin/glucanases superfamily [Penicillium expansum]KGO57715.1 Concanavalin A-like lectin/glucanases superfamily [Penicillium expansum]KGO63701.1 Concanavalin A-like lectin/glucanases superfamily [Penicillium expansum]